MNQFCILIVRSKMLDCHCFILYNKKDHRFENLSEEEYKAFLSLSKNNDIITQKADKGNTVVLLDKSSYIKKIKELLADTSNKWSLIKNTKLIRKYDIS